MGETCKNQKKCINCNEQKLEDNHNALDKKCPVFIKERELQAIMTLEKADRKTANKKYSERHGNNVQSFAAIAHSANNDDNTNKKIINRPIINYSQIAPSPNNNANTEFTQTLVLPGTSQQQQKNHAPKVQILPRTTSKRQLRQLQADNKKKQKATKEKKPQNQFETLSEGDIGSNSMAVDSPYSSEDID